MLAYLRIVRSFGRDVHLLFVFFATAGFGLWGVTGVLQNLYLLRLGYDIRFVGILAGVGMLAFACSSLPAGAIARRFGARRGLIAGQTVAIASFTLFLFVETLPPSWRAGWMLGAQFLFWVGSGMLVVNNPPFLMERLSTEERNHGFAVGYSLLPLAGFAGSLVSGLLPGVFAPWLGVSLNQPSPYRLALWVAVVCYCIGLYALLATHEVDRGRAQAPRTVAGSGGRSASAPYRLIAVVAVVLLLTSTAQPAATTFFTAYLDAVLHTPIGLIGLLVALARLLSVPATLAAPLLVARWGHFRTFTASTLAVLVGLLPLALVPTWAAAGIGFVALSAASAISGVAIIVFHQQLVRPEWRSTMSGGANSSSALGQAVVALGGGFMIAAIGFSSFMLAAGAITLAGTALFCWFFRLPRGEAAAAAAVPAAGPPPLAALEASQPAAE